VGKGKQAFGIHRDLICFHSPYFKATFQGRFEEAVTGEVVLENTDPKVFGLFADWLYTGQVKETLCGNESLTGMEKQD
jgi:BTB/POZ domain